MQNKYYRPELDALRFWACASVLVFHFLNNPLWQGKADHSIVARLASAAMWSGSFGVDLFFCLSAFLITTLLQKECDKSGDFNLKNFYARRALRILPLYFAIVLVFCFIHPIQQPIHWQSKVFLSSVVFGNLLFFLWGSTYVLASLAHLWSIAAEEQFYFAWPIILKLKSKRLSLTKICLVGFGISAVAKVISVKFHMNIWVNTLTHMDPMITGILFADLVHRRGWSPSPAKRIGLGLVGLAIPFLCRLIVAEKGMGDLSYVIFFPAVAFACACLIGSVYGQQHFKMPEPVAYLGKISYGIYMFHVPVQYWFFTNIRRIPGSVGHTKLFELELFAVSTLIAIGCAMVSYKVFEAPILKLKDKRFGALSSAPSKERAVEAADTVHPLRGPEYA